MNAPGSLLWLLQFEALLWWRNIRSRPAAAFLLFCFIALAAIFTFTAGFTLRAAIPLQGGSSSPPSVPWIWLAAIAFCLLFFVTSLSATPIAIANLYERRDLDLLLSSPLSPQTILAARLSSIAMRLFLNLALYIVPYSLLVVAFGLPHLLGIYPGAIGICLLCASLVTLGLLVLVRLFGLQRARTLAQILTVGASAVVIALGQFARLRAASTPSTVSAEDLLSAAATHPWLGSDSWLWFPARTLAGDLGAIVLWLGFCGGVAAITVRALERDFFQGGQQAAIAPRSKAPTPPWRFSGNFTWVLLLKEWRLLWRNPTLISRLGTQLLILGTYTLAYLLDPDSGLNPGATFAIAQTICGSRVAGTLTKITLSGEEAPELLQTAPRSPTLLSTVKLLSALIPSWLLLTPLAAIALWRGESWLAPTLVGMVAGSHAGFLVLCEARSHSSKLLEGGLGSGAQKFDPIGSILGLISMSLWSTVALLVTLGWWLLTPVCLLPLAVITGFAYARNYLED